MKKNSKNSKNVISKFVVISLAATFALFSCKKKEDEPSPSPIVVTNPPTASNTLKGRISTDKVLVNSPAAVDYYLDGEVIMEAKLTIEPGVVVVALSGASLDFSGSPSAMISNGTAALPIVIRSESGLKGAWKGIRFSGSNNALNSLNYTTVADGGSASFNGDNTERANLRFAGNSQVRMKNCTITNSAVYGIYEEKFDDLAIVEFQNNVFSKNTDFPIYINDQNIASLGNTTTFSENSKNYIAMVQKDFKGLVGNVIWKKQAVPYLFNDADGLILGYLSTTGGLTLEAGVNLIMGAGSSIVIGDNSNTNGYLKIDGTSALPVTISGEEGLKGSWKGILISTNSVKNVWTYANISDAGSAVFNGIDNKANICLGQFPSDNSSLTITNCTTNNSLGFGVSRSSSATNILTGTFTGVNNTSGVSGTHN